MNSPSPTTDAQLDNRAEHANRPIDMQTACTHTGRMASTIQIRNVPEDVHRRLRAKAALEGLSLSEYMLREATRVADHPTMAELRARLDALPKHPGVNVSAAEVIREERASR